MSADVSDQLEQRVRSSKTFFRGETVNYYPRDTSLEKSTAIDEYMVHGWMPKGGVVEKSTPVVAFGSCFAGNVAKYLDERGYNVLTKRDNKAYVTRMGDGIVHTFAIRQQFEWAWQNKTPSQDLWHGYQAEDFGYSEDARRDTVALFNEAKVFIITLGLSEVWYDEPTGEVFWRAIPSDKIDPSRHKFRVSTVTENLENLRVIHKLIREFRPDATILFSLSPIPLTATFRPVACITANAVSKAVLRVALDELFRGAKDSNLFYFPSYEIVTTIFNNQWTADRKHVYGHILDFNMKVFEHYFCVDGINRDGLETSFRLAQELDNLIGKKGHNALSVLSGHTPQERKALKMAIRKERAALAETRSPEQIKAARIAKRKTKRIALQRAKIDEKFGEGSARGPSIESNS
ncbi:GSCFA domain-containing protein [Methylobacterium sp. 77]|uniref:GSCFA domain-containing protein n=1 Tax=Methylobacterium sp. 77 TaxID=1101192 RepID=UPI0009DBB37E|nr:GSCFA domain-containing protein [Methylobacterium sp. 77]